MAGTGIKVSGTGLVTSLGAGVEAVYGAVCRGETGFRPLTRFPAEAYAQKWGGQLPESLEEDLRTCYEDDDISVAMMKRAGEEALGISGAAETSDKRLGLVLATNFGPMETLEWAWRERLDTGTMDEASYAAYGHVVENMGDYFGCGGPRLQLSMSCASGAAAVHAGCDLIRSGRADRVLVLAYDSLTEYCWCGLSNLRTITTDTMRPFDRQRSGTIFSEGAAGMVLSRGNMPGDCLGWVAGSATNNNGYHMTAPRKDAEGSRLVMMEALRQAGLCVEQVEQICAHGTSTHANDETEAGAFRNMFGERLGTIPVSAYKSELGHMLGGAGLAEAVLTLAAMKGGVIPPVANLKELDPLCQPVNCGNGSARVQEFQVAVTNSAGIGGNNGALVLTRDCLGAGVPWSTDGALYVKAAGWVLPQNVGQGAELWRHPEWIASVSDDSGVLASFNPKEYVKSVKGYLDPAGAYLLSVFSMIQGEDRLGMDDFRGICTATRYGACRSAYGFFEQLVRKGSRFASPLIFPHGYASAAGNLGAIECGWCGPHLVLMGNQQVEELLAFAWSRLQDGSSREMMIGAYESVIPQAVPDGTHVLNGALGLRLSADPGEGDLAVLKPSEWKSTKHHLMPLGAVAALGTLLLAE